MRFLGHVEIQEGNLKPSKHLTRGDTTEAVDIKGQHYLRLDLPSTKTTKPGERRSVWLVPQGNLCPIEALQNLARVVPAVEGDLSFSSRDNNGAVRLMAEPRFLERFNGILTANRAPQIYGHSLHIGGTSHYMISGVNPEIIVRIQVAGRWRSLAYDSETCIRCFW